MFIEQPIWLYWLICGGVTVILFLNQQKISLLLSPALQSPQIRKQGYWTTIALGWGATIFAAVAYIVLTQKEVSGFYQIPDLLLFSSLNGCLEQCMFIFWLLVGCRIAEKSGVMVPWKIFGIGFVSYAIFSGAIHALFWVKVLPPHHPSLVMPLILVGMSYLWMWLFWRYRAIVAIIAMHMVIDFLTVGYLHFSWFESYQWSIT